MEGDNPQLTEKEKKFDLAIKPAGGIWPIKGFLEADNLRIYGNRMIEWAIRNGEGFGLNLPNCNFDIINNPNINALALKDKDEYYIGINIGTIICISNLFNRMLSHPEILSKYGDVTRETPPEKMYNAQIVNSETLSEAINEIVLPKDTTRANLARYLTQVCLKTIVMHEYAHIKCGHCDYKVSLKGNSSYNEAIQENPSNDDNLIWQALEMDADCSAVNNQIMEAEVLLANPQFIPKSFVEFYTNLEDSIHLIYFANYCYYRLFGLLNYDLQKLNIYTHPPSWLRQTMMAGTMYRFIEINFPKLKDKIPALTVQVTEEVETGFSLISEQKINGSGILLAASEIGRLHTKKILEAWNTARPLLEPFTKAPLAPIELQP